MNDLGKIIRDYRKRSGITATQLAEKIGVSQGTISHIETGRRSPSVDLIHRIAEALNIPSDIINDEEDIKNDRSLKGFQMFFPGDLVDITYEIKATLSQKIDLTKLTKEDKESIMTRFNFESAIAVRSILDYIKKNNDDVSKLISNNIKKEVEEILKAR